MQETNPIEIDRRLRWLLVAVWRQMTGNSCIEASFTLHGALVELGIKSIVQPVAAFTSDAVNGCNTFLGKAGYDYFRKKVAVAGHVLPNYVPVPGAPEFFVSGGHVVVLVPELDLLMDATLDQIPNFPIPYVIGPAEELSHEEAKRFGTDQAWVGYLLVDDSIQVEAEHRKLIMDSGAVLARKGLQLDFSFDVLTTNTKLFERAVF